MIGDLALVFLILFYIDDRWEGLLLLFSCKTALIVNGPLTFLLKSSSSLIVIVL
jgi:hypothetical protein